MSYEMHPESGLGLGMQRLVAQASVAQSVDLLMDSVKSFTLSCCGPVVRNNGL